MMKCSFLPPTPVRLQLCRRRRRLSLPHCHQVVYVYGERRENRYRNVSEYVGVKLVQRKYIVAPCALCLRWFPLTRATPKVPTDDRKRHGSKPQDERSGNNFKR